MSRRSSNAKSAPKGPPPAPDIYVALLLVSFAALLWGCVLLGLELNHYNWAPPT